MLRNVVTDLVLWIEKNINKKITAKDVVSKSGYSEFYLQRAFAAQRGETISRYIRRRKLELAASMLSEGENEIIDISLKLGFNDVSTFYRSFRRKFGVTPRRYITIK